MKRGEKNGVLPCDFTNEKLLGDLDWIWSSSPLLRPKQPPHGVKHLPADFFLPHEESYQLLRQRLLRDLTPLRGFLKVRPRLQKLGLYGQALYEFLFTHLGSLELLSCDLVIESGGSPFVQKRTLGSLDFLVKDRISQQVSHIELAVKLFLCEELHDESEDAAHWIGPEGVDRLDLKLQKLREHQIPLLHSEESLSLLKSRWGLAPETIQSFVLIKGYGFVSRTDWTKRSKSHWLAAKNIIGTWKRVSEPSDSSQDALPELPALPKNQWLGFRGEPDSDVPAWGFTVHDEWPKPSHPTHPLFTASGFV